MVHTECTCKVGRAEYHDDDYVVHCPMHKEAPQKIEELGKDYDKIIKSSAWEIEQRDKEIERLKGHLPDVCINETCDQEDNLTTGDVVANVMNTAKGVEKLTEEEYEELADLIGNYHRQAMHVAVKDTRQRNDILILALEEAKKVIEETEKANKFLEHDNKNLADDNKFMSEAVDAAIKDTKYFEAKLEEGVDLLANIKEAMKLTTVCAKCHLPWTDDNQHDECWRVVVEEEEKK